MNSPTSPHTARIRTVLPIIVLWGGYSCALLGQPAPPAAPAATSAIETHFAAAQQAQQRQDYSTAEGEYRAVLALAPNFAEVHMNLGLIYQLQDRLPDAMTEFRRALLLKAALAGANFFLGVDYVKTGDGAKAVRYLTVAVREQPNRADIWSWLAMAQEMAGNVHAEVATIKHALTLKPEDVDLLYLLGQAYERLGKDEIKGLEKAAPGSSRAEQLLAESYAASSEWPSAVIHFQNALAAAANRLGLHEELGEVLLRAGKLKQAVREFGEELRLDPKNFRAIVRRGEARLIQEDVEGALQDWTHAVALDELHAERILGMRETGFGESSFEELPDIVREKIERHAPELRSRNSPAAHFALAFLAAQRGNSAAAIAEAKAASTAAIHYSARCSRAEMNYALQQEQFSRVAVCAPSVLNSRSTPEFRIAVARGLVEAGGYEQSLKALSELPPSDRHAPEASYWRARCYEKLATAAYLRLYRAGPNSHRAHQLMGDLAAVKGEDGKAIDEYRAAIALKPSLPDLHYSLGHLLWKDLKVSEARTELEAELALNPGHAGALDDLGDTYLLEHQPDKALSYLNRALLLTPANPDIHRDLGTAFTQLRDYRRAEVEFKIALASDHDGAVHYKLGRVYQALGEKENAAREFALSTALNRESHSKLEKQTERLGELQRSQD